MRSISKGQSSFYFSRDSELCKVVFPELGGGMLVLFPGSQNSVRKGLEVTSTGEQGLEQASEYLGLNFCFNYRPQPQTPVS